jgi:hypothetical protein
VIELKWRILRAWSFHSTTVEAHSDKPSPTSISVIHRSERSTCSGSKRMSKAHSDRLKEREAARERHCRRMAKRETAPAGLLSEHLSWTARETVRQRCRSRPIDYKVSESSGGKVFEEWADGTRVGNIVRGHLTSLFGDLEERGLAGLNTQMVSWLLEHISPPSQGASPDLSPSGLNSCT